MENREHSAFTAQRLPWLIAVGAFIVYLVTLNRWVSLSSLPMVALLSDPTRNLPLSGPLTYLVTLPLRWLPTSAQILALNGLSALCAAAALGLLARSVALLPQDRTRDQRQRERSVTGRLSLPTAWVPPLFAALVCGLQLAFWQHATAGTGQMLNLLLLAYLIRCLLEYRVDERESWLTRLALLYGVAVTNNAALIACLPLFLVALVWIRGREFFRLRFIVRMVALGLAGLSLYLLLPLLSQLTNAADASFWETLWAQLVDHKNALVGVPRYIVLFGALFSILPALFIGIRWPSSFGDTSVAGVLLTNLLFRVVHGLFLVGCLWVIFDSPFSPRVLIDNLLRQRSAEVSLGLPFLGLHYLTSLCVGYLIGYFLLLSTKAGERTRRRVSALDRLTSGAMTVLVWVAVGVIPVVLVYRNWQAVRINDGRLLRDYAALSLQGLTDPKTILLADDPVLLNLVRVLDQQTRGDEMRLVIDTRLLPYTFYQAALHRLFPDRWQALPDEIQAQPMLGAESVPRQLQTVVQTNQVCYLHPSFGYFFEMTYLRPTGLSYPLSVYTTNQIAPPTLSDELYRRNAGFWQEALANLEGLPDLVARGFRDARAVGRWYSRAMDYWAVELQQSNRLGEAEKFFELAIRFNPDNVIAQINLEYNRNLQQGKPARVDPDKSAEEQFGAKYRTWDAILAGNGPVDEPGFCLRLGELLTRQGNFRQALLQYSRALELEPDNRSVMMTVAYLYLKLEQAPLALQTAKRLRDLGPDAPEQIKLALIETEAHLLMGETEAAERLLLEASSSHPNAEVLLTTLAGLYKDTFQDDKALQISDRHLQMNPGALAPLVNKAVIYMRHEDYARAGEVVRALQETAPENMTALLTQSAYYIQTQQFAEALRVLDQILELDPTNQWARINRAIALLQSKRLDEAKQEYLALHERMPREYRFHYGLGEIAYLQKNWADAIKFYGFYLQNAPTNTDEARQIADRLRQLQTSGP